MAYFGFPSLCSIFSIFSFVVAVHSSNATDEEVRQEYIVYMGSLPKEQFSLASYHLNFMQKALDRRLATGSIIRTYKRSFSGFAARLTVAEREKLASMKAVVSVFPSVTLHLQTTRSWDFMGFSYPTELNPVQAKNDVIIGVIDSGVWPESESFKDDGFGPVPQRWKGVCAGGLNFTCNRKIIGARFYASMSSEKSARDNQGHGTHTASTAAGSPVNDASFYGLGKGTARGAVPSARISIYKPCNADTGCQTADVMAAFDDAIADGVDIITVSLGPDRAIELVNDPVAIGAFHAMERGILTTHSAGNSGPSLATTGSTAPWLLSVAASTLDRRIVDKLILGDGKTLEGNAINAFTLNNTMFPLAYGKDLSSNCTEDDARSCYPDCLDKNLVRGKIVICDVSDAYWVTSQAGAAGAIMRLYDSSSDDVSSVVPLPGLGLKPDIHDELKTYLNSTKKATANILASEVIKDNAAPEVALFSSRGPNAIVPDIMKPDITAPGVQILAAFPPTVSPSGSTEDKRSVAYSFLSGTSMSCPHAAGAAAYVKMLHPDWSPSAIKSALMTTAWPMNSTKNPDAEFGYGSGHLNPSAAAHPGLVYEAFREDYVKLLCTLNYNTEMLRKIFGNSNVTCPGNNTKVAAPEDVNYPALTAAVEANQPFRVEFHRTVTNVGASKGMYVAKVTPAPGLEITVEPKILSFTAKHEKKSFEVTVSGLGVRDSSMLSGFLTWSDKHHNVRSPVIVHNPVLPTSGSADQD